MRKLTLLALTLAIFVGCEYLPNIPGLNPARPTQPTAPAAPVPPLKPGERLLSGKLVSVSKSLAQQGVGDGTLVLQVCSAGSCQRYTLKIKGDGEDATLIQLHSGQYLRDLVGRGVELDCVVDAKWKCSYVSEK